jgi:sarcosine oxidase subunit gamma
MVDSAYGPLSPFAAMPASAGTGEGVVAGEREGLGIARITARNRQLAALEQLVHKRLHLALPAGPRRMRSGDLAAAGVGPECWLMTCESAGNAFAAGLRDSIGGHAAVVDLSDAYVMLRLAGARVREALAKLVPVDLHERSFQVDDVAQTVAEHMAVTLWRLEDTGRGEAAFELSVGRSFAQSLYRAVHDSAAEFGFVFETR